MKATNIKLNTEIYAQTTRRDGKMWSKVLVLEIGTSAYRKGQARVIFEKTHWQLADLERTLTKQGQIFWNTTNPEWVTLASIKDTAENYKTKLIAEAEAEKLASEKRAQMEKNQEEFRQMVIDQWSKNEKLKAIASGYSIDAIKRIGQGSNFAYKHIVEMNHTQLLNLINYVTELENTITELKKEEN